MVTRLAFYSPNGKYFALAMETPMGPFPIMFFPNLDAIRELGEIALDYYNRQRNPVPDVFEKEFSNGEEEG